MNRIPVFIGMGATLLGLAGCGNGGASGYKPKPPAKVESAEITPGQEMTVLPLATGAQWVYTTAVRVSQKDGQAGSTTGELTFRCTDAKDANGGREGTIEVLSQDGKVTEKQSWRLDQKGLSQTAGGTTGDAFTPPFPNLMFPVTVGDKFSWQGSGPFPGGLAKDAVANSKVLGYEEVDTDMGRMQALAVESRLSWSAAGKKGKSYMKTWWKPNYGFIRFRQELEYGDLTAVQMFRLKSYTPGK